MKPDNPARMPPKILSGGRLDDKWGNIQSIIGYRFCCGILLAGLQAEVAAIIFSSASSPDVVNFAREREALLTQGFFPRAFPGLFPLTKKDACVNFRPTSRI